MSVQIHQENKVFTLNTPNSTYRMAVADGKYLGHVYYGKKLSHEDGLWALRTEEGPNVPSVRNREKISFMDVFPSEFSVRGVGDFREPCLEVHKEGEAVGAELHFVSAKTSAGKPELANLPATFGTEEDCETLTIVLEDPILSLRVTLLYTAFNHIDAITRSVRVENTGKEPLILDRVLSACLDMDNDRAFESLTLSGAWARERNIIRTPLVRGQYSVGSLRGESSHQENPFMALVSEGANEDCGEVYGINFVYSGNFLMQAEVTPNDALRFVCGIHPGNFSWKLEPGEVFTAPEVVMVYSDEGLGKMSRGFHDLYRKHLIRSSWLEKERPILINNWEATYFNFDTEKLIAIAKEAKKSGIEMLVMDDGWFGKRNSDSSSLGDWTVNKEKLQGGLDRLVKAVNAEGLKFGIWFEPEMVSPDSDLFRTHPDWALQLPGRVPSEGRQQLVLDLTRKEVRDYVYESVAKILRSSNIAYVKWDMNRSLTDLGSSGKECRIPGELSHRYMLAVYELQNRLITEFPELLLENCSSGGARFDAGMLFYSPQIWCSDDMDVEQRLLTQEGTALVYPLSCMGAHVGASPNHTTGRIAPFKTRGHVALAGTFGYELDITRIPMEDRALIPGQVAEYHRFHALVADGDYYRLASYSKNHEYDCYMTAAKDASEALVTFVQVWNRPNYRSFRVRLKGLDAKARYALEGTDKIFGGDTLMYLGLPVERQSGDLKSTLFYLKKVED